MFFTRIPTKSIERSILPDTVAHGERARRPSAWQTMREDYRRHGSSVTNGAFISLCVYRFGRWGLQRRSALGRKLASKVYGFMNLFVANITKIWIPPQVTIGDAFHIVNNEGSLSIHPEAVIGDRLGVMHNVTIGTNMKRGVPTIGDDVFIGTNSTVLGNIRIGDRVRIGANTAVSTDVPSDSVCVGSPARIYPRLGPLL
ncbi:Serine acetyltransferase [Novosphingobium resinovorum]|uniref:Serine acetyltransferase n=2 Tax=Novosphingobium resinovorum TaxID=158500 RepID=A0A031K3U2_9SPHN|nr:Serine acetyltransferase [Novosphingobium resinovorum]